MFGKKILYLTLVITIYCSQVYSQNWWENSKVLDLHDHNFWDIVGKEKAVFVKFFKPWCGYCRRMSEDYEKLWELYNGQTKKRNDIIIARVNCEDDPIICQEQEIYGYPALILYKKNSKFMIKYEYRRTVDFMSLWIEGQLGEEKKSFKKQEPAPAIEDNSSQINLLQEKIYGLSEGLSQAQDVSMNEMLDFSDKLKKISENTTSDDTTQNLLIFTIGLLLGSLLSNLYFDSNKKDEYVHLN